MVAGARGDPNRMANITATSLNKAAVSAATDGTSGTSENSEAESSMGRANRLIREHRKRVEEKASIPLPDETRNETPIM
jgi:hypothetical protein